MSEKVLGLRHPATLKICFGLAKCLRAESKLQEATVYAQRAADDALSVLGPEHPDTKKYEQLKGEIVAKGNSS